MNIGFSRWARRHLKRLKNWRALRWTLAALLTALLILDLAFPPPLPGSHGTSTLVIAADGSPLRAFADAEGIWRYPATPESVSPLYPRAGSSPAAPP